MIRKILAAGAVAMLMVAGFLTTGCSSTSSSDEPNALTGSDSAAAQKTAYLQGHNKLYGYYGAR